MRFINVLGLDWLLGIALRILSRVSTNLLIRYLLSRRLTSYESRFRWHQVWVLICVRESNVLKITWLPVLDLTCQSLIRYRRSLIVTVHWKIAAILLSGVLVARTAFIVGL